jgi:hypothetical protein
LSRTKTAVRLVQPSELNEYVRAGWTKTDTVNHGGVDWFVVKRNRDDSPVTSRRNTWTRTHEEITKRMKPNTTYFEDDLFKL